MLLNCGVEKTLETLLDCKEIQQVNPKGNQSWIFLEGLMLMLKLHYFGTWYEELTHLKKNPWFWKRLKAGKEGDDRGWDGWMASPTQWTWVWVKSGSWRWTGRPGMLQSMRLQRVRYDWATELSWTQVFLTSSCKEDLERAFVSLTQVIHLYLNKLQS